MLRPSLEAAISGSLAVPPTRICCDDAPGAAESDDDGGAGEEMDGGFSSSLAESASASASFHSCTISRAPPCASQPGKLAVRSAASHTAGRRPPIATLENTSPGSDDLAAGDNVRLVSIAATRSAISEG